MLKRLGQASSKGAVSGMASSFNLEDANGIELINKAKRTEAGGLEVLQRRERLF